MTNITPCEVPSLNDDQLVSAQYAHGFRSILTSMLFLCQCNVHILTEVTQLQGFNNEPKVMHLKRANAVLKKAQSDNQLLGLHFPRLQGPFCLRAIGDANHTTKTSVYPQEGQVVLLMHDVPLTVDIKTDIIKDKSCLSGYCHPMAILSNKAKKVAHSTSMGETNCALSVVSNAQMIALRITEMQMDEHIEQKDRIQKMMQINTSGAYEIPLDHWTDCKDVFELVTGLKGVPQERLQRLPIMALREERITTRIRWTLHVPTEIMVADAMTKPGVFKQMMKLLTTGYLDMEMVQKDATARRIVHRPDTYTESDLESIVKFNWAYLD